MEKSPPAQRRLSAIMMADVVGYSGLERLRRLNPLESRDVDELLALRTNFWGSTQRHS